MPLYEYVCPECERRFERLARASEASATAACPSCGGERAARVLSTFFAAGGAGRTIAEAAAPSCGPVG